MFSNPKSLLFFFSALASIVSARPNSHSHSYSHSYSHAKAHAHAARGLSSKRGLAYNSTSPPLDIFAPYASKITWGHDWYSGPFNLPGQFQYVATLADITSDSIPVWNANVQAAISRSSGITYLMSFNEPDQPGSKAQMGVDSAVAAYRQYIVPKGSANVKLGSPSVTNGVVNGMGLAYLSSFLKKCSGCQIDFVPVHWYGCDPGTCTLDADVQMFQNQMNAAVQAAQGRPVWITEFQHKGSLADQKVFLDRVLPWLDDLAQAAIERYSYFMVCDGSLINGDGLSEVGKRYTS